MNKQQSEPPAQKKPPPDFLLETAPQGQKLRLKHIDADRQLTHRLTELGLTPGVELMIIHDSGGPMVLSVRDSRVAVGRGLAGKMLVSAV